MFDLCFLLVCFFSALCDLSNFSSVYGEREHKKVDFFPWFATIQDECRKLNIM